MFSCKTLNSKEEILTNKNFEQRGNHFRSVVNNLSNFIFGLIRAIGMIILAFSVVQIGLSIKSHDPSPLLSSARHTTNFSPTLASRETRLWNRFSRNSSRFGNSPHPTNCGRNP